MFAGLDIKFNDAVSLPSTHASDEMDRISTVSVSQKNRVGTKKERIKKRRDELLKSKLFISKLLWYFLVEGEVECYTNTVVTALQLLLYYFILITLLESVSL